MNSRWLFLGEEPIFCTPDQQLNAPTRKNVMNLEENGNQEEKAKPPGVNCFDELRKCRERCDSIQDLLNQKNDELNLLYSEYISHLKGK